MRSPEKDEKKQAVVHSLPTNEQAERIGKSL